MDETKLFWLIICLIVLVTIILALLIYFLFDHLLKKPKKGQGPIFYYTLRTYILEGEKIDKQHFTKEYSEEVESSFEKYFGEEVLLLYKEVSQSETQVPIGTTIIFSVDHAEYKGEKIFFKVDSVNVESYPQGRVSMSVELKLLAPHLSGITDEFAKMLKDTGWKKKLYSD